VEDERARMHPCMLIIFFLANTYNDNLYTMSLSNHHLVHHQIKKMV